MLNGTKYHIQTLQLIGLIGTNKHCNSTTDQSRCKKAFTTLNAFLRAVIKIIDVSQLSFLG